MKSEMHSMLLPTSLNKPFDNLPKEVKSHCLAAAIFIFICLPACAQVQTGDNQLQQQLIAIDHVPIVVPNLGDARNLFSEVLKFKIKNGRPHEGVDNFFVKFVDGTYLEFITPVDSTTPIGKYYTNFLAQRAGGTSLALSVRSADTVATCLRKHKIPFHSESNPVWNTVELLKDDLFYIEYRDKTWMERKENTTHDNQAMGLKAVWWISDAPEEDIAKFKEQGFAYKTKHTTKHELQSGTNTLFVVDHQSVSYIKPEFKSVTSGVLGFTIKVKSLDTCKQLFGTRNVTPDGRLIYPVWEYNFFLVFEE